MAGGVLLLTGIGLLAAAIVLGVLAIVRTGEERPGVARSLTAIDKVYGRDTAAVGAMGPTDAALPPAMRRLGEFSMRLSPGGVIESLARRLDQAGNPEGWTGERILSYKGLGLLAGGLLGFLFGLRSSPAAAIGLGAAFGGFGFYLPDILLYNTALKRREAIQRALPDVLDMLTICVEAGLGFDAAVAQVARNTIGPLSAECARMLQEMQIGATRVEALRSFADRTGVAEVQSFCAAVVQGTQLGIAIGDVLREQAKEMRTGRRQRAEELAQKVPVKILFPVIFCIFPALFVVVLGPGVLTIMHAFSFVR
jgi:tight adherence protein C